MLHDYKMNVKYVFANCDDEQLEKMKELFIDLSPWSKKDK